MASLSKNRLPTNLLLAILFLLFLLAGCGPQPASPPAPAAPLDLEGRIQAVENNLFLMDAIGRPQWKNPKTLADRMANYQVPGVSIAVIHNYQIDWAKGYGFIKAGSSQSVDPDTRFHAGSIAKTVSAAATLVLVEQGLLDLDAPVNEYLRAWQVPENQFTTAEKVTLRRLLSHSSGIMDGLTDDSPNDDPPGYLAPAGTASSITLQQLLDAAPGADVNRAARVTTVPGTHYRYANANYAILELLISDISRKSFPEFMQETILTPLNMSASTFQQPLPPAFREKAVVEHNIAGQPFAAERYHFPFRAAGGLWTTPTDLAHFAIAIMQRPPTSPSFLPANLLQEIFTPQIATPDNPLGESYGLGVHLAGKDQHQVVFHSGATWGSTCILWFYPELGEGAVIMTNKAAGQGSIVLEILLGVAAAYGWPLDS